jgi:hypothetical protein
VSEVFSRATLFCCVLSGIATEQEWVKNDPDAVALRQGFPTLPITDARDILTFIFSTGETCE